jgi:DNA-binding winged helix-turn-helix (wHTH) protein
MQLGPAPTLMVKPQDGTPREIEWAEVTLSIGRDRSNDIVIDHPLASRRHAKLERNDTGCYIQDLGSTNGTFVNGQRISEYTLLHNQDQILVADTLLTFHDPEATMKGPLPDEIMRRIRGEEDLHLDSRAKEVYVRGTRLDPPLTVKEFQLLELLSNRKGQVVSKDEIANNVWDYEVFDYNAIDALIYRLRQRIEPDPAHPRYVVTVRGFGYKLVTNPEP